MIHFYEMMSNISLLSLVPHAALWEVVATDRTFITFCDQRTTFVKRRTHETHHLCFHNSKISTAFKKQNHVVQFNLSLLINQIFKLLLTNGYEVLCDFESIRKTDEMPHLHGILLWLNDMKCLTTAYVWQLNGHNIWVVFCEEMYFQY